MRLLHARARSSARRRCSSATPQPTREQIHEAMAGNLCRCGAYPEDRARDPARGGRRMTARFVRTQKEMEGRYEDVWVLVDETDDVETLGARRRPHARRPAGAAPRRRRAGRRARALHGRRRSSPGMLHAAVLRSPVAHGRVRSLDLEAALAIPGVRAVIGPESELSLTTRAPASRRRARVRRPADRGRRGRHARGGAGRACARSRSTSRCSRTSSTRSEALNEQRFTGDPSDDAPRRRRGGARRRRGDGRARARHAGAAADAARAARRRRLVGRRPAHRLGLDAGDVLGPRRARDGVRAAQGRRPRADGVRRRRLRRQAGRRLRGARGGRARADHRPAGAARQRPPCRAARRRAPRRDAADRSASARRRDGTLTAIDAEAVVGDGPGRLGSSPCSSRRARSTAAPTSRALSFPAKTNLRAQNAFRAPGRDGGHRGVRAGDRRARARARASIRSSCAAATTPTSTR